MNGVMSNIQYMPSPHGVSKRIRMYHDEPFSNHFQEIGQYGCPDKKNLPDNIEILKTTHVWMRNCQFKEERNAFLLVSRGDASCSEQSNGTFRDSVFQSLSFPDSDLMNTIQKETVKPSLVPAAFNLLNACEDTNRLSASSMLTESKQASTTLRNGMDSLSSSTVLHSDFETRFKDKLSGIVKKSSSVMSCLDKPKGLSGKDEQIAESTKGGNDTKTLKGNQYRPNTSTLSEFHYESGYQNNSVQYITSSSECLNSLDSNGNYLEKIRRMLDITITPVGRVGEYKDQKMNENPNESNVNQKIVLSCPKDTFEEENVNLINHLNFETKVLSWKTYSRIVKRLPDYKLFSDVIQKAVKKVKHPKIFVEPISSEESSLSNKTLNTVTENVKVAKVLHENIITKSKQNLLLCDLDEFDAFLDFVSSKIQEMIILVCSTSDEIRSLGKDSEDISMAYHIRNIEYLAEINWKLSIEDTNMFTSTRNEILTLGDQLLQQIGLLEQDWMDIHRTYKMNLVTISRFVYMLCLIPIENKLTYQRDLVFAAVHQVENQIKVVEAKEKELDIRRESNFSKMMELHNGISRFYRLDEIFDELCQTYFD